MTYGIIIGKYTMDNWTLLHIARQNPKWQGDQHEFLMDAGYVPGEPLLDLGNQISYRQTLGWKRIPHNEPIRESEIPSDSGGITHSIISHAGDLVQRILI